MFIMRNTVVEETKDLVVLKLHTKLSKAQT